jgi:hypothetical protein
MLILEKCLHKLSCIYIIRMSKYLFDYSLRLKKNVILEISGQIIKEVK